MQFFITLFHKVYERAKVKEDSAEFQTWLGSGAVLQFLLTI